MLFLSSVRVRLLVGGFCASALLVTLHAIPATAADPATFDQGRMEPEPSMPSGWTFTVGAGVMVEPEYEGAESYSVIPVPFISIAYEDWFEFNPEGLSAKVVETGDLRLDALVGYDLGRDEDDGDKLRGLGDIDFGVTVGGRLSYEIGGVELFTEVKKTIEGSEGLTAEFGAEITRPISEKLIVGLSASGTLADANYMQSYFGVTAAQSAASGLSEYEADAGLKSAEISASATYLVDENWFVRGEAELGVLLSDAADSPIVEREVQPAASLFVGYRF